MVDLYAPFQLRRYGSLLGGITGVSVVGWAKGCTPQHMPTLIDSLLRKKKLTKIELRNSTETLSKYL